MKDYISYFTYTPSVSTCTNHVVLMSSLINRNQFGYVMKACQLGGSILASYTLGAMGQNSGHLKAFFFHAATVLFFIVQRITTPKFYSFRKSVIIHNFSVAILVVALVLLPPHKFVFPPC